MKDIDISRRKTVMISGLQNLFFVDFSNSELEENFDFILLKSRSYQLKNLTEQLIRDYLNELLHDNDTFILSFFVEDGEPSSVTSTNDLKEFISDLKEESELIENEQIYFEFRIDKSDLNNYTPIYDIEAFSFYLKSLSIQSLFFVLSQKLERKNQLVFRSKEFINEFSSETISFLNINSDIPKNNFDREKYTNKIKSISHSPHWLNSNALLPNDLLFDLTKVDNDILKTIFKTLLHSTLIFSLCDVTSYENDDSISYKLNGYKIISGITDRTSLSINYNVEYLKIYNWIIDGGNLIDKIGIARNVISLHAKNHNSLLINEGTFESITSSFKIYEKDNIKQYIDVRNKISDQLKDYSARASEIANDFATGFQKSLFAILTFFSSIIAVKVITQKSDNLINLVSVETYTLSLVFISISIIYLIYSRKELKEQLSRFNTSYENMKNRYLDLLSKDDIGKILNNDNEFNQDSTFINKKVKWYTTLWIWSLVIIFSALTFLRFKEMIICSMLKFLESFSLTALIF